MSRRDIGRPMLVFASALVLATLIAAVWVMDSPAVQRDLRLDQRRVAELSELQVLVEDWARTRGALPVSLAQIAAQPGMAPSLRDPLDGTSYGYAVLGARRYRLCAVFATDTAAMREPPSPQTGRPVEWAHPAGPHCFERTLPRENAAPVDSKPVPSPR